MLTDYVTDPRPRFLGHRRTYGASPAVYLLTYLLTYDTMPRETITGQDDNKIVHIVFTDVKYN
jgi:hypothetical protein